MPLCQGGLETALYLRPFCSSHPQPFRFSQDTGKAASHMAEVRDFLSIHKKGKLSQGEELNVERPKQQSHTSHRFHCPLVSGILFSWEEGLKGRPVSALHFQRELQQLERRKYLGKTGKIMGNRGELRENLRISDHQNIPRQGVPISPWTL